MIGPLFAASLSAAFAQSDATDGHQLVLGDLGAPGASFGRAWSPVARRSGEFTAGGALEFAKNVLSSQGEAGVPSLFAIDWRADYAPVAPLHVFVAGPLFLASDDRLGGEGYSPLALGDVRVGGGGRLPIGDHVGVGVEGDFVIPSGPAARLLGYAGPAWNARAAVSGTAGPVDGLLSVGMDGEPHTSNSLVLGGNYLAGTAGLAFELPSGPLDRLQLTVEGAGRLPLRSTAVGETPMELTSGLRAHDGRHAMGVAFAHEIGSGSPSADWRVLLSYGIQVQTRHDTDLDGILDAQDDCPSEAEVVNDYLDDDGCPDRLGTLNLSVENTLGGAVGGAEILFGAVDATTTADGEATLDNVMPGTRAVIAVRNPAYNDGVAIVDSVAADDQDLSVLLVPKPVPFEIRLRGQNIEPLSGIVRLVGPVKVPPVAIGASGSEIVPLVPGEWRAIISADGYGVEERTFHVEILHTGGGDAVDLDENGIELIVSTLAHTIVTSTEIALSGAQVRFKTGGATLEPDSKPLLEEIAERLVTHPEIRLVEIQGHTDNVGDDATNLKLSEDRVAAVRAFLIDYGVEPQRIRTVGFGKSVPLDTNTTEEGRARNRRVQFVIIEREAR